MEKIMHNLGLVLGILGLLLCIVAGGGRVAGYYYLAGVQSITILTGGIALMVAACMLKLYSMPGRS